MVHGEDKIPKTIDKSKVLLVEGDDDVKFFETLMIYENFNIDEYQIIPTSGSFDTLFVKMLTTRPGFKLNVKIFGIIRDANDTNVQLKFNNINNKFNNTYLSFPNSPNIFTNHYPRVGVFIIGNDSDIKNLEDLCLKTVENRQEISCVDDFFNCITNLNIPISRNLSKSRAQAYLATKPKYVSHIGLAAKENYWDFNSPVLDDLKNFLDSFR